MHQTLNFNTAHGRDSYNYPQCVCHGANTQCQLVIGNISYVQETEHGPSLAA